MCSNVQRSVYVKSDCFGSPEHLKPLDGNSSGLLPYADEPRHKAPCPSRRSAEIAYPFGVQRARNPIDDDLGFRVSDTASDAAAHWQRTWLGFAGRSGRVAKIARAVELVLGATHVPTCVEDERALAASDPGGAAIRLVRPISNLVGQSVRICMGNRGGCLHRLGFAPAAQGLADG